MVTLHEGHLSLLWGHKGLLTSLCVFTVSAPGRLFDAYVIMSGSSTNLARTSCTGCKAAKTRTPFSSSLSSTTTAPAGLCFSPSLSSRRAGPFLFIIYSLA
ncbi:hypothetical protein PENSPDRAFT_429006 [Peniophora sp. CONT]|nr:hypothetical protein PENSPDRAFT_429006 [Peniophora sp. CONT]